MLIAQAMPSLDELPITLVQDAFHLASDPGFPSSAAPFCLLARRYVDPARSAMLWHVRLNTEERSTKLAAFLRAHPRDAAKNR